MLLFLETTLPRQARAVRHAVRVRVLPPEIQDEELADDAQEPPAPRLERHAQAAAEDVGAAQRAGPRAAPPLRPERQRARAAAAARAAMTSAHGLNRRGQPAARAHVRPARPARPAAPRGGRHTNVQYYGLCQNDAGLCRILMVNRIIISKILTLVLNYVNSIVARDL